MLSAPVGINVLDLNAAALRPALAQAASSAVVCVTSAGKDPTMAQLRWQKPANGSDVLAMAQIRWQRTRFTHTHMRLVMSRFIRLVRFSFLILIGHFVTLDL